MDEIKIDYKGLYEAVREQRNRLADSEAALSAAVKMLSEKLVTMEKQRVDA